MKLEENIAKLEQLADSIEGDDVSLERSLEIFQQSVAIADEAMKQLSDCKGKLVVLQDKMKRIVSDDD